MDNNTHFNLYCLNPHCRVSIYHRTSPVCLELNAANFLAEHHCQECRRKLASLIDVTVSELAASASVQLSLQIVPVCLN